MSILTWSYPYHCTPSHLAEKNKLLVVCNDELLPCHVQGRLDSPTSLCQAGEMFLQESGIGAV